MRGKAETASRSVAIQQYNALYATHPTIIQAASLMTMAVPVVVFSFAQRAFMRGVVVTGVET
jgi:multiple sugar transport system permease protein